MGRLARNHVGVRELKASLSAYLRRARRGESILVTDRGEPVARLVPPDLPPGLVRMLQRGELTWSGRKPELPKDVPKIRRGSKTLAELVIEDRG